MLAVSDDGRFEGLDELSASFHRFPDGFRAARIMVAGMNAILIDGRCGAHNAERIEEMNVMALFGKPDCRRRAVNSCSRNSNSCPHKLLWKCVRSLAQFWRPRMLRHHDGRDRGPALIANFEQEPGRPARASLRECGNPHCANECSCVQRSRAKS